jgi:tetratricopeptide (TPR) repeat protein
VAAAAGLVAGVALLAGLTVRQISFWHDDVSLWSRPIAVSPRLSGRVYTERSQARERLGDLNGARADMDDAIAIASSKNYAFIYTLYSRRARILAEIGRLREAADDYGRAIQADASPGVAETLRERSDLYMAMGETALADADRRLADQLDGTP